MIPELSTLKAQGLCDSLVDKATQFLDSEDASIPRNIHSFHADWQSPFIGKTLVDDVPWSENTRKLLRFFIHLSDGAAPTDDAFHEFLFGALRHLHDSDYAGDPTRTMRIVEEIESNHRALSTYVAWHLGQYPHSNNWTVADLKAITETKS